MSTLTTLLGADTITSSRTAINTNFSNLNTDKIETSTLDTDTALAANSDLKIPSQKAVKAYVDAYIGAVVIETTTGVTHSLTTTAGQKVIVLVKGTMAVIGSTSSDNYYAYLKYNAVTKDTALFGGGAERELPFALQYTETPGAGTQNITVIGDGTLTNVVIIVMKIG